MSRRITTTKGKGKRGKPRLPRVPVPKPTRIHKDKRRDSYSHRKPMGSEDLQEFDRACDKNFTDDVLGKGRSMLNEFNDWQWP